MDFSEQSHIEGKVWDVRCDEKYILSLICFARMDFSELYHIHVGGETCDVKCDEKSISSKKYQWYYVYRGFGKMKSAFHYNVTLENSGIMLIISC